MVLVRRIRRRGANIVVEANGEVLFAPTGDVGRWTNRFSHRVRAGVMAEAPTNKRPRWAHYGRPLRSTFTASTVYQPGRMKVYAAVGSGAPHAYYVDQGTGIFAGNGPYRAKVLPPWHQGSPTLYESTWRPGGPEGRKVAPVMIKGQRGQGFFDKGLKRGFQSMRMRSFQVPGEGKIGAVADAIPTGLLNFLGNTPPDEAFKASLREWRSWRDTRWRDEAGPWGGRGPDRSFRRTAKARAARDRKQQRARSTLLRLEAAREQRRKAENARLLKQREAKALGKKRAAEAEAKFQNGKRKLAVKARAQKFAKGKDIISGQFLNDPDTGLAVYFRVTYRSKKGNVKHRDFPV